MARGAQTGAKSVGEGFNRFVEGDGRGGGRTAPIDESKKDFWDSFADAGASRQGGSAIGTSAVRKAAGGGGGMVGKKEEDNWDKW